MLVNLEFESRSLRRSLGKCGENTSLILGCLGPRSIGFVKGGARWSTSGPFLAAALLLSSRVGPKFMPYRI